MDTLKRIISAKDYGGSARKYIRLQQRNLHQRGIPVQIVDFDQEPTGTPVRARIWQGQWIADCECKGASFVDPDEPVFFCFGCGNRAHGRKLRPVEFPAEWKEIEQLILERPVEDLAGLTDMERAGLAKPILFVYGNPLMREWKGETLEELHSQQDEAIAEWRHDHVTT